MPFRHNSINKLLFGRPIIRGVGPQNKYSLAMYFSSLIYDDQQWCCKNTQIMLNYKINILFLYIFYKYNFANNIIFKFIYITL